MKALISALALVLGFAAVSVVVRIQNNPLAFTRLDHRDAVVANAIPAAPAAPAIRIGTTVVESVPESVTVWLEEVQVVGRFSAPVPVVQAEEAEPEVTVLPAPCTDGEYRLLEEGRGVRLMCNLSP